MSAEQPDAEEERFAPEWDLARVGLAAQGGDGFLNDLMELAENGIGTIIGVLINGMVAVGSIGDAGVVADALDEQRRMLASRMDPPEDQSQDEWSKAVELFVTANRRLVEEDRQERQELRESAEVHWDFSHPVRGRTRSALEREVRFTLTLVEPQIVAPGEGGAIRPAFLRVPLAQIVAWWVVPTDESGKASFRIFETQPD